MMPTIVLVLSFSIEGTLLVFHVSVAACVASNVLKRNASFKGGFYNLFLVQSVADITAYLMTCVVIRLVQYGYVPKSITELPKFGVIVYFINSFGNFYEYFSHAAIAVNRYTAIQHPVRHAKLWKGKSLTAIFALLLAATLCCASIRLAMDIHIVESDVGFAIVNRTPWANTAAAVISIAATISMSFLSCGLELRTFVIYRRLSSARQRVNKEDFRLLVYAMFGLLGQSLVSIYFLFNYTIAVGRPSIAVVNQLALPYIVDVMSLGSSVALFISSVTVRRAYCKFYGIPHADSARQSTVTAFSGSLATAMTPRSP